MTSHDPPTSSPRSTSKEKKALRPIKKRKLMLKVKRRRIPLLKVLLGTGLSYRNFSVLNNRS